MADSLKLLIIIVSFPLNLTAQEKIETDRPDQTESPYTVPCGYFQFELGMNMEKDKKENVSTTTFVHPTSLFKYGINQTLELRIESEPSTIYEKTDQVKSARFQLEPVEIGFKTRLWEEKGYRPKTSFLFHTTLPFLSSKEFKDLPTAPNYRFTFQNTLSKKWALGYNLGMEWSGETTEPAYTYTFAPGFEINDKFSGFFEVFGFIWKEESAQNSVDAGIYYFPNKDVKFDLSAGFGISKEAPDFYIAVGFSFRFKK